jgi:hypothetical protein
MKLDLSGRQHTDITPLLVAAWKEANYGETLELGPAGTYYGRPAIFPWLRPWFESRIAIEGCGYQGVCIEPDPTYPWGDGQTMWRFKGGRVAIRNLAFGGTPTDYQVNYLHIGGRDDHEPVTRCEVEALDLREYGIGLRMEMIDGAFARDIQFMGGPANEARLPPEFKHVVALYFRRCNDINASLKGHGGQAVLIDSRDAFPGAGEGIKLFGNIAETELGIQVLAGDCFQIGDGASNFDSGPASGYIARDGTWCQSASKFDPPYCLI